MKGTIKIFFIICILSVNIFTQNKYWEDLSKNEQDKILKDTNVYKPALYFYYGKIKAGDDSLTHSLLDAITGAKEFNLLYFYLFNHIVNISDGALAEVMGEYCYKMISGNTIVLTSYMTRDRKTSFGGFLYKRYSDYLGWKLAADIKEKVITTDDYEKFKLTLRDSLKNSSSDDKETINLLIAEMHAAYIEYK